MGGGGGGGEKGWVELTCQTRSAFRPNDDTICRWWNCKEKKGFSQINFQYKQTNKEGI